MVAMAASHKRRGYVDIRGFEVMKQTCATCPFVTQCLGPAATAPYLESIVTFQAQHLCHTANDKKICRGGRDITLRAMCALGIIKEATDECFERTSESVLGREPGAVPELPVHNRRRGQNRRTRG